MSRLYFQAHRSRPMFAGEQLREALAEIVGAVCLRNDYHLLEASSSPEHLRLLVSLKPDQALSRVVKMLKGNLSQELGMRFPERKPQFGRATSQEAPAKSILRPRTAT